jgi:hypothetical protein
LGIVYAPLLISASRVYKERKKLFIIG